MAETLVKLMPATVIGPRTASRVCPGGVDRVGGAAGGRRSSILLGPEGTSAFARLWRGCLVFLGSGPWPVTKLPVCGCVVVVWLVGLVVV